ncbi:Smr/MutS family protein [Sulfobacillus harzensis]|nr:Smr/MutS family protein [Sulfobacillus harzensis]
MGLELDLRGMTGEEAAEALDKYLDDAVLASAPFVRIIHGKGTGVLRRVVSEQLKHDPRVVTYRLGGPGEGGDGVTVAQLEETD